MLSPDALRFLLAAQRAGVDFQRTAMIGRQAIWPLHEHRMRTIFAQFDRSLDGGEAREIYRGAGGYSERLFQYLGAEIVDSVDVTSSEGATIQHDMNDLLPDSLESAYSFVLDGGSLEHVFNYPVALANCMRMVRAGGHLVIMTPMNNFGGHGFYQLSPDLFFRALTPANGFELRGMLIHESALGRARWSAVSDPDQIAKRVNFANKRRTMLFLLAQRVNDAPPFRVNPQQADYAALWDQRNARSDAGIDSRAWLKRTLVNAPWPILALWESAWQLRSLTYRARRRNGYSRVRIQDWPSHVRDQTT